MDLLVVQDQSSIIFTKINEPFYPRNLRIAHIKIAPRQQTRQWFDASLNKQNNIKLLKCDYNEVGLRWAWMPFDELMMGHLMTNVIIVGRASLLPLVHCTGAQHNQATQPSMPSLQCPKCNDVQVRCCCENKQDDQNYKVQTVYGFSSCAIIMAIIGFFHSKFNLDHQN